MLVYQRVQLYRGFWTMHFLIGVNQQVDITQIPDFQTKMVIYRPINQVVAIVCLGWSKPLNNGDEQMSSSNHQNMGDGTDAKQCEVDIPLK